MACLLCRYFQPIEPPQHSAEREASTCPYGREWNQYTAIRFWERHREHLTGFCHLHPKAEQVSSGYVCASIATNERFHNPHWGVERLKADDNLFEWAGKALQTLRDGGTWQQQELNRLKAENKKLRAQLKNVRRISASRLAKLQADPKQPRRPSGKVVPFPEAVG